MYVERNEQKKDTNFVILALIMGALAGGFNFI